MKMWTDGMIEGLVEEEVFIRANDIYNEEYSKGEYCHEQSFKWGFQEGYNYSHENDKLEISLKEGYQFVDENGNEIFTSKIILKKKKQKYPKTYEECCDILQLEHTFELNDLTIEEETLFKSFIQLKRCRDAYWKIAGGEMGLGKPWEPDWKNDEQFKYIIICRRGCIIKDTYTAKDVILAFPTAEMRDAFYENFKELINECKELL